MKHSRTEPKAKDTPMTRHEKTSARVARIAAKVLAMKNRGDLRLYHHPNDKAEETDLYWRDIRALAISTLPRMANPGTSHRIKSQHFVDEYKMVDAPKPKRPSGPATIKGKRPSSWPPSATGRGV